MEVERPKTVYEKIWWGSVKELEKAFAEIFEQKKPEVLDDALDILVARCAAYLAKGEVNGFAEVGQRLGRAMRRSGFPTTWEIEDHPLVRLHGQIQGIARVATQTGEKELGDDIKALLRQSKHANEIIRFLALKRGARFSDIEERLRETSGSRTPGVYYPLTRLMNTGLVRKFESDNRYELTYLGGELAALLMSPPLEEWDVTETVREFWDQLAALAERADELESLEPTIREEMGDWLKRNAQVQKVLRELGFPDEFIPSYSDHPPIKNPDNSLARLELLIIISLLLSQMNTQRSPNCFTHKGSRRLTHREQIAK
uniref:Uncharacterized protein n=1 Tax=Candidatus Kentrum sp. DK TaxID=2126562 RepID=A0A450SXM9_9GAMM|nr:MAG: hypothetical protein BECKDK2373C_GA0170839_106816 [Candidatus Kentron sp. DK]